MKNIRCHNDDVSDEEYHHTVLWIPDLSLTISMFGQMDSRTKWREIRLSKAGDMRGMVAVCTINTSPNMVIELQWTFASL